MLPEGIARFRRPQCRLTVWGTNVRVIAGVARGRKLQAPQQGVTRPTPSRVREALFSMLAPHLDGARVLDVCAGSGALGIEALSRGAKAATFVERDPRVAGVLRQNLEVLPPAVRAQAQLIVACALRTLDTLGTGGARFDVILCDAPFAAGLLPDVLARIAAHALLAHDGVVALEHHGKQAAPDAPDGLVCVRTRRYGEVALTTYTRYTPTLCAEAR